MIVFPLPLIAPPDHVSVPVTVTSPEPPSVPPLSVSTVLGARRLGPFNVSVLEGRASVCVPVLPPTCRLATVALTFTVTV